MKFWPESASVGQLLLSFGLLVILSIGMVAVSSEAAVVGETADHVAYGLAGIDPLHDVGIKIAIAGGIFAAALVVGEMIHKRRQSKKQSLL